MNIGTAGTIKPNFTIEIDPIINLPKYNHIIAKLSSTGELLWAT